MLQEKFDEIRKQISGNEFVTREINISQLRITENSFKDRTVLVKETPIPVDSSFFMRLASFLKLGKNLTNEFLKNDDHKVAMVLMNQLKDYHRARGIKGQVLLIANPATRTLVDICEPDKYRRLTSDTIFDITSRILNDNPNLSVETIDWSPSEGRSSINILNREEVGFASAGKDEFFKFGFSLIQTNKDTLVQMYNQRLICSNGLVASLGSGAIGSSRELKFNESFKLEGSDPNSVKEFLMQLEDAKRSGFVPSAFKETLDKATNTKASLFEVEQGFVLTQKMLDESNGDMRLNYLKSLSKNYFTGYDMTLARLARKGHNPDFITQKQKSFIKTPMSVWDLVNSMTYLGSNNSGIPLSEQHRLKDEAGKIFAKGSKGGYDLEFAQFAQL
jgi:hypothetical protein